MAVPPPPTPLSLSSIFHPPSSRPQLHQEEVVRRQWAGKSHRWCFLPWTLTCCQLLPVQRMAQRHGCRYLLFAWSHPPPVWANTIQIFHTATWPPLYQSPDWLRQLASSLYTSVTHTRRCTQIHTPLYRHLPSIWMIWKIPANDCVKKSNIMNALKSVY